MREWKGTRKKKIMRVLAAALAFCLLFTYPSALETLSVFAAETPVEDDTVSVGTSVEPTEEAEEQTVTVETAEQTAPTETAEQTAPVETAEQTAPLGTAAEQAIPVGTAAADLPQSDIADSAVQSLIDRIAALPDSEEYLANEPDADAGEAYDQWMEGLHRYAGEAINMQEAYDELTAEQLAQIPAQAQEKLSAWVQTAMQIAGDSMETLADSGTCGDNLTWTFDDAGTLTISGSGAMKDYQWDGDGPWHYYHSDITSIVISDTVTRIGNNAFVTHNNNKLTSINIPNSVKSIGEFAFSGCTYLSSIVIPASVTSIEMNAFRRNSNLTSVTFTGSTPPTLGSNSSYGNCFPFQDCGCVLNNNKGIKIPCSWGDNFATSENGWVEYKDNVTKVHGTSESFDATPATCTTPGQNAGTKCKNCGTILSGGGTIAAKGHTYQYTASGNTITQGCNNGCGHSATATLSLSGTSFNYTGSEIKPTATVTCSDNWAGAKPTVKYANNINVGTAAEAYIEVSGKRASCYFTIKKKNPPLTVTKNDFAYGDDSGLTINTTDGVGRSTVYYKPEGAADSAYTTTPPTDLGTYIVKVTLAENDEYNSISATDTFKIYQENLNDTINISIEVDGATYTGDPVKPTVRVQHRKYTSSTEKEWVNLVEGKDYTVTCSNNTNVGTAKVTVTGKGNYTGTIEKTFTITTGNFNSAVITLETEKLTYDGSSHTIDVTKVEANGKTLQPGTDYTVSGNVGTDAGDYTITITGQGNYADAIATKTFTIDPKPLTADMITIASGPHYYTGNPIEPEVTVKDGEKALAENTDYTVEYSANTEPGTATVTVKGKGNYAGTLRKDFTVKYQPLPQSLENYVDISPAPNENGWYGSDIEITPKSGYGVGGDTAAVTGSVTITAETDTDGETKTIFIKDGSGNIYQTEFKYKLDKTEPEVDLTGMTVENGSKVLDNYITGTGDMKIKIPTSSIKETISGVAEVSYTATPDNGEPTSGTIILNGDNYEIALSDIVSGEEFVGKIELTVKDNAGHTTNVTLPTASGKVIIEEHAPAIKITLPETPKPNENGWYNTDVTVAVNVSDAQDNGGTAITSGGIAQIQWKDGESGTVHTVTGLPGASLTYEKDFTIDVTDDGDHTYYIKTTDNAGNESQWQSITVKRDTTAPAFNGELVVKSPTKEGADIAFTPSEDVKAYWIVSDTGTAPTAQEIKEQFEQNGGEPETVVKDGHGLFTLSGLTTGQKHTVYVVLEDVAGNLSEVKNVSFLTRQEAPDITLDDLNVDYIDETITLPTDNGELEAYTDPSDTTGSKIEPNDDGTLPIEPGTKVYIRYPAKEEGSLTTPASASVEIVIPARPSTPAEKQVTVTETTVVVKNPAAGEEYVLVEKGQTPDWNDPAPNTTGQFTGLTPNKEYDLYVRKKATDNTFASDPVMTTIRTYVIINEPTIEGDGKDKRGNTAPKPNKPNEDGSVTFTGTYSEEYTPVIKTTDGQEIIPGATGTDSKMTWDQNRKKGTWEYTLDTNGATEANITVEFKQRTITGIDVTPNALTIYADDPVNESIDALSAYVEANSSVKAVYDNKTRGTAQAAYTTGGSFAQKGAVYTYSASANAKTDSITLTVKPVSATVTAPDKYLQTVKAEGYTADEVQTWLPEKVTLTYKADGYSTKTESKTVTWNTSSISADFGTALGENTVTGTIDLPAWATGANSVSMVIEFVDKNVLRGDQLKLTLPNFSYGAQPLPNPTGSVTVTDTDPTYTYLYSTDDGATWIDAEDLPKSDSGNIIPGEYRVKMTYTGDTYIGEKTASFTVKKNVLTILPGTYEIVNKNYDGTINADIKVNGQPTLSGVVEGDTVTLGGILSAVFAEVGPKENIPVTVTGFILEGEDAQYYELKEEPLTLYATINNADGTPPGSEREDNDDDDYSGNTSWSTPAVTSTPQLTTQPTPQPTDPTEPSQPTDTQQTPSENNAVSEITESTEITENSESTEQPEQGTKPDDTDAPIEETAPAQPQGAAAQTVQASVDNGKLTLSEGTVTTGNVTEASKTTTTIAAGDGSVIVTVVCEE